MNQMNQLADWDRPKWVRKLSTFLNDTLVDFIAEDGSDDEVTDKVTAAAMAVVCEHYGHYIENDQCMMPAHRYCMWCTKRFSDAPLGNTKPV